MKPRLIHPDPESAQLGHSDATQRALGLMADQHLPDRTIHGSRFDLSGTQLFLEESLRIFKTLAKVPYAGYFVCSGARMQANTDDARLSYRFGKHLGMRRKAVITGGGPGGMEYSSKGAIDGGGKTCGICIQLEHEEKPHQYNSFVVSVTGFPARKLGLFSLSGGAGILPGGKGTLDEGFEAVRFASTLGQRRAEAFPVAWVGEMYKPLEHWLFKDPNGPGKLGYLGDLNRDIIGFFPDEKQAIPWMENLAAPRLARLNDKLTRLKKEHKDNARHDASVETAAMLLSVSQETARQSRLEGARSQPDFMKVVRAANDLMKADTFLDSVFQGTAAPRNISLLGGVSSIGDQDSEADAVRLGRALLKEEFGAVFGAAQGLEERVATILATGYGDQAANRLASLCTLDDSNRAKESGRMIRSVPWFEHVCLYGFTERMGHLNSTCGMIAMPGGVRVLDTLCEAWNLIMCKKIKDYPIVLFGTDFWKGFDKFLQVVSKQDGAKRVVNGEKVMGYMSPEQVQIPLITDDPREAIAFIKKGAKIS